MTRTWPLGATLAITLCASAIVQAAPTLSYNETALGGGFFQVAYTAVNGFDPVLNPGFDLFDIVFNFPSNPFVLSLPTGWESVVTGTTVDSFSSFPGEPPGGTDVPPGQSLGGFIFLFNGSIGSVPFAYSFNTPGGEITQLGLSTTAVPDPATLALFGTGIGSLLLHLRKFNWH
jgi:hypothetical protein